MAKQTDGAAPLSRASVCVVSHVCVTRSGNAWFTKNRVGAIADRLAELGWDVTLLARESSPDEFLTHSVCEDVRVEAYRPGLASLARAARRTRGHDAALVFMPTVRTALLAIALGQRAVGYWGNAWGAMAGAPRWRVLLETLVARRVGVIIVAGRIVGRRFARAGSKVALCVPLVPVEVAQRLRSGRIEPVEGSPLRALFVGTIIPRKGLPELLDALRELPHVECRIVGPVADETLAARLREELPSLPGVSVSEYLEWPELREAYEWANVLVLPSHMEGFPRVVYEAAAFGAAIVVTPVGAIPDRLVDGRDAVFVPVGNPVALSLALRELAEDPARVTELAAAAAGALRAAFPDADPADQFDRRLREVAGRTVTARLRRRRAGQSRVTGRLNLDAVAPHKRTETQAEGARGSVLMISRFAPPRPSGAGLQALHLSKRLRERGWDVTILTTSLARTLPRKTQIEGVPALECPVRRWSPRVEKLLFVLGVTMHLLRNPRRYAVVHLHGAFYLLRALRLLKPLCRFRVVYKATMQRMDDARVIHEARGRRVLNAVDAWACVSSGIAATVAESRAAGRVLQVPNGVELARFRPATDGERAAARTTLGLPDDRRVWLSVGVLVPRKRPDLAVRAWSLLPEPRPLLLLLGPTDTVLKGSGDYANELTALIRDLGLASSVRLVGMRSDVDVFLRAADGFIFTSCQEGLPTAPLEALASGLPVVSTEFDGVADVAALADGRLVLVPAAAEALARAVRDCKLRPGAAPGELALADFDYVADRYSVLYGELMGAEGR